MGVIVRYPVSQVVARVRYPLLSNIGAFRKRLKHTKHITKKNKKTKTTTAGATNSMSTLAQPWTPHTFINKAIAVVIAGAALLGKAKPRLVAGEHATNTLEQGI